MVARSSVLLINIRSYLHAHPHAHLPTPFRFAIDDHTGDPQPEEEVTSLHYDKVCQLQRLMYKHWPKLKELALSNCGTVEKREVGGGQWVLARWICWEMWVGVRPIGVWIKRGSICT